MWNSSLLDILFIVLSQSYRVDPAVHDHGAARMSFLRQRKREAIIGTQKCRTDPKCSDVLLRDNEGFVECVDGGLNYVAHFIFSNNISNFSKGIWYLHFLAVRFCTRVALWRCRPDVLHQLRNIDRKRSRCVCLARFSFFHFGEYAIIGGH